MDVAAALRQKLIPLLGDLHFAGTMQGVHRAIRRLFLSAFEVTAPEYAPIDASLEDYREGLRVAGVAAAFAVELATAGSDAPAELRKYVGRVLQAFTASHIDTTLPPIDNHGEFFDEVVTGLFEDFTRIRYSHLARWVEPARKPTRKTLKMARTARVGRFLDEHPGVSTAAIWRAAETDSSSFYAWRTGKYSDTSMTGVSIDSVLAGRTPLRNRGEK